MSKTTKILLRATTYEAARLELKNLHKGRYLILGWSEGRLRFAGEPHAGTSAKTFTATLFGAA